MYVSRNLQRLWPCYTIYNNIYNNIWQYIYIHIIMYINISITRWQGLQISAYAISSHAVYYPTCTSKFSTIHSNHLIFEQTWLPLASVFWRNIFICWYFAYERRMYVGGVKIISMIEKTMGDSAPNYRE